MPQFFITNRRSWTSLKLCYSETIAIFSVYSSCNVKKFSAGVLISILLLPLALRHRENKGESFYFFPITSPTYTTEQRVVNDDESSA